MERTKENAVDRYCELIVNSWTWERLTPKEAAAWVELIENLKKQNRIKGTAKQRISQTADFYHAFLIGCGYDGFLWREPDPDNTPKF